MDGGGEIIRACPACGEGGAADLPGYSLDSWRVVRCAACDFVYLRNAPVYDRLKSELAWEKTFEAHAARVKKARPIVDWLDRKTRWRLHIARPNEQDEFRRYFGPGAVLDVGCGSSNRVPEPFIPYGIEISEKLAADADALMKPRGGACVCAPAVEGVESLEENFFSGIVMRSFLEHEAQPKRLLEGAHRVLKPGAAAFVKVPNYGGVNRRVMGHRWCGFRYPDHVNYFTLASLKRMGEEAGFRLKLLNPVNLAFDDNIHALLVKAA